VLPVFNLLVFNVDWNSRGVTVPFSRILEFTEPGILKQFSENNSPAIERLISLPCLFCEEGTNAETAFIGQIDRARVLNRDVSLEISFDTEVPRLQNAFIFANSVELGLHSWELSRNHWAVKGVDLYRFLLRNVRPRRQRPEVFQIPEHESIEALLASAMMPFDPGFEAVYRAISEAAEKVGLRCRRADNIWEHAAIIQDVVSLIDRSRIVVCDCTGRNPNVFYEIGIAHTLGRQVILITQSENDIPFDLRHLRYIRYLNNAQGLQALTEQISGRMQTLLGH
jgi:hypothetical protein